LDDRKGIRCWVLVCWWWRFYWSFARLITPVVTTTSIILSFSKTVKPGPLGKMAVKTEKERERRVSRVTTKMLEMASLRCKFSWQGYGDVTSGMGYWFRKIV